MSFASLRHAVSRSALPLLAASSWTYGWSNNNNNSVQCEQVASASSTPVVELQKHRSNENKDQGRQPGMQKTAQGDYYGLFPKRQLWVPRLPYPLWDKNWDGLHPEATGDLEADHKHFRQLRKHGVTRHILLIRHGQYDEAHTEDEKRTLTELGRKQADLTGRRLAEMMQSAEDEMGKCYIKSVQVSGMARARETAEIICRHLPGVVLEEPNKLFNEGRPCHTIPGGAVSERIIQMTDSHSERIERAFQTIFHRAPLSDSTTSAEQQNQHEFEIIICHANVIRYWMCRALQQPPETWLRYCPFNCSITYLTIRPTGTVSCRMLGDIGHLPYSASTFSMHRGFNW